MHSDAALVHVLLSAACLVLALAAALRRRPLLFGVLQFSCGWLLVLGAELWCSPALLLLGLALLLPLAALPGCARPGRPAGVVLPLFLALGCGALLAWGLARAGAEDLRPRPVVTETWRPDDPLRVRRPPLLLEERPRHARVLSHQGRLVFEWPRQAGREVADVMLGNTGPANAWSVLSGDAGLEALPRSRMLLRCRFPASGGRVEVLGLPFAREASRLLLVAHARGDLPALGRLLDRFRSDPPDLVVLLGDMVSGGELAGMLALRDLVDGLGTRSQAIPGAGERGPSGLRAWAALFGPCQEVRQSAGVSAVLLDTSRGRLPALDPDQLTVAAVMGGGLGTGAVFLHDALVEDGGGRGGVLADDRDRHRLLEMLPRWKTRLVAATSDGPWYTVEREGVRHVCVGRYDDRLEGVLVTLRNGAVVETRPVSVASGTGPADLLLGWWLRWTALTRWRWSLGMPIALGVLGAPGCLLIAAGLALLRRRRTKHGDGHPRGAGDGAGS